MHSANNNSLLNYILSTTVLKVLYEFSQTCELQFNVKLVEIRKWVSRY